MVELVLGVVEVVVVGSVSGWGGILEGFRCQAAQLAPVEL